MSDELWFQRLAEAADHVTHERAPARLKSKIYSALLSAMAEDRPLLDLAVTRKAGGHLCVFENALTLLPFGTDIRSTNPCRICHARALAERMEHAPIFWPGCPYAGFHQD